MYCDLSFHFIYVLFFYFFCKRLLFVVVVSIAICRDDECIAFEVSILSIYLSLFILLL